MAKIKITQLLCPLRHCILALAFNPADNSEDDAKTIINAGIEDLNLNRFCGICGSSDLQFETNATNFDTIAEATPTLLEEQRKNIEAGAFFQNMRRNASNN